MHAIEDITASLRTGSPISPTEGPQPSTCWTCKSPDVPRMMEALGVDSFYNKDVYKRQEQDRAQEAQIYFSTPNDILRYLWYKKTGFLQRCV